MYSVMIGRSSWAATAGLTLPWARTDQRIIDPVGYVDRHNIPVMRRLHLLLVCKWITCFDGHRSCTGPQPEAEDDKKGTRDLMVSPRFLYPLVNGTH